MVQGVLQSCIRPCVSPIGGTPAGQTAHMFLDIGNSHEIGRATADAGDAFDAKVYQWTQAGALEQPPAAMLDHQNDVPTDISPSLSFSDAYIARNPAVTRVVHVPHAQGSTGFSGGQWAADDVPNDLSEAVARFNAAHAQLISDGFTVTVVGAFYHANRPDFDNNTIPQLQVDIDAMIDYLRANITGGANLPVIIGGGMTQTQLTARNIPNDLGFQGVMDGSYIRKANVGSYDWINQRFGSTLPGLPVMTDDGVHADRAGTLTQGELMDTALIRAQANSAPNDPFQSLASFSTWDGFHDFRSGTGLDFSGNGNDLIQADAVTNLALTKFDTSNANTFVFDRDDGDTDRYWHVGAPLGASYTKAIMLRFDDLNATEGIWQNVSDGTRFFYTVGSNEIRAYHDTSSIRVTISGNSITLNKWHLIVITYDEPTTTMRAYLDGVLIDTNTNVAAHPAVVNEALGAQNLSGLRPFRGGMLFAAYADTVIDQTAITALNTAAQSLLITLPPDAVTDLSATAGNAQVVLSWTAPSDNGSAITDYLIEFRVTGDPTFSVFSDGVSALPTATVTGLTNETSYDFRVSAINVNGTGAVSNVAVSTPSATAASPLDLTNLVFYFDPTTSSTLDLDTGNEVNQIVDRSTNAYEANVQNPSRRPVFVTETSANVPALEFDNANSSTLDVDLALFNALVGGNNTIFVCFRTDDITRLQGLLSVNTYHAHADYDNTSAVRYKSGGEELHQVVRDTNWHILVGRRTGTTLTVGIDGSFTSNNAGSDATASGAALMGRVSSGGSTSLTGHLYKMFGTSDSLSNAEINQQANQLASELGITWTDI